jgi:hypothetical protein
MGTNYYYETDAGKECPTCHRYDEGQRLHIGKGSMGWAFSLRVYPDKDLCSLADWCLLWLSGEGQIRDEYGEIVSPQEMFTIVARRAVPASGLRRHGGKQVQPGEPTYDLADRDFR